MQEKQQKKQKQKTKKQGRARMMVKTSSEDEEGVDRDVVRGQSSPELGRGANGGMQVLLGDGRVDSSVSKLRETLEKIRIGVERCVICDSKRHKPENCPMDEELRLMMAEGLKVMQRMAAPQTEQGRCWVGWQRCEEVPGRSQQCAWSEKAKRVAIGLLYCSGQRSRVQEWMIRDAEFEEGCKVDGFRALEQFFKRRIEWGEGVESNMLCEMIREFG